MYPCQPVKIIIADDHQIFRTGFKATIANQNVLNIAFVDEASNGVELVEKVTLQKPDVVITDINMPLMDGIQACHLIKENNPSVKVIALSMFDDDGLMIEMVRAGASGFLTKNAEQEEVLLAIKEVSEGFTHFKKGIAEIRNDNQLISKKLSLKEFTITEISLIKLICKQLTNKEIAHTLGLSKRTVEDYRRKIQEKLNAKNAIGIVLYALENEIVQLGEIVKKGFYPGIICLRS